jgi:hypothetical protein
MEQVIDSLKKYILADKLQKYGFVKGFIVYISFTGGGVSLLCQLNLFYFCGFIEGTVLTSTNVIKFRDLYHEVFYLSFFLTSIIVSSRFSCIICNFLSSSSNFSCCYSQLF